MSQCRSFCPNLFGHLKLGCHPPHLEKVLCAGLGSPQHLGSVLGTMSQRTGTCSLMYASLPRHHWDVDNCRCVAIDLIQTLIPPNIPQCLLANYKWSVSPKYLQPLSLQNITLFAWLFLLDPMLPEGWDFVIHFVSSSHTRVGQCLFPVKVQWH